MWRAALDWTNATLAVAAAENAAVDGRADVWMRPLWTQLLRLLMPMEPLRWQAFVDLPTMKMMMAMAFGWDVECACRAM